MDTSKTKVLVMGATGYMYVQFANIEGKLQW